MFLSRTLRKLAYRSKAFVFDRAGLQEVPDTRDRLRLEESMGFHGQFDEHRRFQMSFLKEQGLLSSHMLLEIGCGPLTGGIPIIEYLAPGNYVGVDVRSNVLDLSWREVSKAALSAKNPRLICSASFGDLELGDQAFDFIFSFSVLFHLSDDILESYFKVVRRRLKEAGVCFANVNTIDDASTWLEFPFVKRDLEKYQEVAAGCGLKMKSLGEIRNLGFRLPGQERRNQMLSLCIQ
jgi:SAM-dependent methyltransferase